jgi:hypothetical protein
MENEKKCGVKGKCCKCVGKILIFLLGAVVTILALAMMKPDEFTVTRSAVIGAPPAVVFEKVNNLQNWNSFSPWANLDPDAKTVLEGPQAGKDAVFRWDGNGNVGAGAMTIIESKANELVKFKLDFIRPFAGTSDVEFTFHPDGAGTFVTWTMHGRNDSLIPKVMSVFMSCEKMMGDFFEEGLANLDRVSKGQQ